ncbi:hypothetical protein Murmansk-154 [Murmansk poxvirus]|uniref:Uncharacterized protein n=1 Tax=Murmansk poxvirus TaxID=2025359 RepID=A0A223FMZ1_9POXV|nr:hypothetical protein CKM52_gp154 [Murmansk poxvirus]AST09349.1 hypothetical protein Murmansk-154 [Murmansk poxvirus]
MDIIDTFPLFGISKIVKYVSSITQYQYAYIDKEHSKTLAADISRQLDEKVYINDLLYVTKLDINNTHQQLPSTLCTLVVCLSSFGGSLISIDDNKDNKQIISLIPNHAVIVDPLKYFCVFTKGEMTMLYVTIDVPSKRLFRLDLDNILYSNNTDLLGDDVFVIRKITDYSNKHICTQIFTNDKWYSIVEIEDKKFPVHSTCIGTTSSKYVTSSIDNKMLETVCNTDHPFDSIVKKHQLFNSMPVKEQILYGKICYTNEKTS